jgi:hypothetical protein
MATSSVLTPKLKKKFLKEFARLGNISQACRNIGIQRRPRVYDWRDTDPEFFAALEDAKEEACDNMEMEAWRRAIEGTVKPVFYLGEKVGEIREYSDTLLIFLLKGALPKKYRDNATVETTVNVINADFAARLGEHLDRQPYRREITSGDEEGKCPH